MRIPKLDPMPEPAKRPRPGKGAYKRAERVRLEPMDDFGGSCFNALDLPFRVYWVNNKHGYPLSTIEIHHN